MSVSWAAIWAFLTQFLGPLIKFFNEVMKNWAAYQQKQSGRDEFELEVRKNEESINKSLRDINPHGLPDDEAFKP